VNQQSTLGDLLNISARLTVCLDREVELLRGFKPAEVRKLQQDKTLLADSYRALVAAMKGLNSGPEPDSEALRQNLREATGQLRASVGDNLRALKAMRDVSERVMRSVVNALEEPRMELAGYNRRGAIKRNRRSSIGPVTLHQRA